MKTAKKTPAGPSFTTPMMRLILTQTERIIITRKMLLILFTALCIAVRYLVLLNDQDLIKPNKQVNIIAEELQLRIWPANLFLQPGTEAKIFFRLKTSDKDSTPAKRSMNLFKYSKAL